METERIFERHDPVSGDALLIGLDGDRLFVRVFSEGSAKTVLLTDPADGARLARALAAAVKEET